MKHTSVMLQRNMDRVYREIFRVGKLLVLRSAEREHTMAQEMSINLFYKIKIG